ncbi:MAG: hypothetical protein KG003_07560 [Bacteroidetes bacterium]|nr:hypothetical protein [Bacteroidota bacterium]
MKKLIAICVVTMFLLAQSPSTLKAETHTGKASSTLTKAENARLNAMGNRLNEIYKMDKSNLSRSEKWQLRNEVLEIRNTLQQHPYDGVYISFGGIIIILLLILIFF